MCQPGWALQCAHSYYNHSTMPTVLFCSYMIPVLDRFRPLFERHGIELIVPDVKAYGRGSSALCGHIRRDAVRR
jgi:hypothetical protein